MTTEKVIIIGILIAFFYYEFFGVFPGGIIVPGFLVLYFEQPDKIFVTIVVASVAYLFVYHILSRYMIIYGIRRFFIIVLTAYLIGNTFEYMSIFFELNYSLSSVGYIISGIIANNYIRQGWSITTINLFSAIILIKLTLIIIGAI